MAFLLGILFSVSVFAFNDAAKNIYLRKYENDPEMLNKLKLPGYPIMHYLKEKNYYNIFNIFDVFKKKD